MNWPASNRILIVAAECVVVAVRQIQTTDMSVAVDAEVTNFDCVWSHVTNQRRPHKKTIPIEFPAASIVVIKHARLNRVALLDEVLPKNIRHVNVLLSPIKTIQPAVSILL